MTEALLNIRDLRVSFAADQGTIEAVHGLSLSLQRGEILGLVGESGSGKSTVAKSVLRILGPPGIITGGQICFQGRDLLTMDESELRTLRWREMAMVFQSALNALNPVLTIAAQITDTLQAHQDIDAEAARDRGTELLRMVHIDPVHLDSYPHELSGGMRQRVVIAISLAWSPNLLIMDEPTTALDVLVERQILREVLGEASNEPNVDGCASISSPFQLKHRSSTNVCDPSMPLLAPISKNEPGLPPVA